jgi:acyl-CoA hydrolase
VTGLIVGAIEPRWRRHHRTTLHRGGAQRIVSRLSGPVSTPRSDGSVVVTEYGVADLRGCSIHQRRERLLAIAHADHQDDLFHHWHLD